MDTQLLLECARAECGPWWVVVDVEATVGRNGKPTAIKKREEKRTNVFFISKFKIDFEGVRAAAAESLPYLLDCAKLRGDEYVRQMWNYMNKELFKAIEIEPDHEVLGELFSSLGKVKRKNIEEN